MAYDVAVSVASRRGWACDRLGVEVIDASRTPWSLALVAPARLGLILALSDCGGGRQARIALIASTTITTNDQALAAAEYRMKANAICLRPYRTKLPWGKGRAARLTAIVKAGGAATSAIRALNPPVSLAGLQRPPGCGGTRGDRSDLEVCRGVQDGAAHLASVGRPEVGPLVSYQTKLWTELGAKVCARGHA